jgi:hypothetical protein
MMLTFCLLRLLAKPKIAPLNLLVLTATHFELNQSPDLPLREGDKLVKPLKMGAVE